MTYTLKDRKQKNQIGRNSRVLDEIGLETKLPFFTLLLLISFASVNAVLFTPALPSIATFFAITDDAAQYTITCFLIGYAFAQLIYGPIANRFGRKTALYIGISLQIISSLLCPLAGYLHNYELLVTARFMCALGSGAGFMMCFTLLNECYEPKIASQKISYLLLAFAITPGLSVAIGGFLNTYLSWTSCFYTSAVYGMILLVLVTKLPETLKNKDVNALKISNLINGYGGQFKNPALIIGGLLMGCSGSFIYIFAATAPFIAINLFGMSSAEYGIANILPSIGLFMGSLTGAQLARHYSITTLIRAGIGIAMLGVTLMFITMSLHYSILLTLFVPAMIIYFGLCFLITNGSTYAMSRVHDKAHGSAVMSFINIGLITIFVLILDLFTVKTSLILSIYFVLCILMAGLLKFGVKQKI